VIREGHRLVQHLFSLQMSRRRLLSLSSGASVAVAGLSPWTRLSGVVSATGDGSDPVSGGVPTTVTVRAIANGGRFLGDDIGGAMVTIRDAISKEVLSSGVTRGGSGPADLMTISTTRSQPVPDEDAAAFETTLMLVEPRLVEVSVFGPLAAQGSARHASVTRWLQPGDAAPNGNQVLLVLDGLIVQFLNPPTHFLPTTSPPLPIDLHANVTMMCGCPIGPNEAWQPQDFQVSATISGPNGGRDAVVLAWNSAADDGAPSQFIGTWTAPASGVYMVTVTAYQASLDNVGVDRATFTVP
jgi:hypothetical protein